MLNRSIPIATEDCARRVGAFASALSNLCEILSLELVISDGTLWVIDSKRPGSLNPQWPWVADIELPKCKAHISEVDESGFPEEFASLSAARSEGRDW